MQYLRKTLHEDTGLRAEYIYYDDNGRAGSDILVITFTERGNTQLNGLGFGGQFLLDLGADILAVKSTNFRWFEELAPAAERIYAQLHAVRFRKAWRTYPRRICYGSSMGAHAAIRYSRAFQANRVVAISPLFDIMAPEDQRYAQDIPHIQTLPMTAPDNIAAGCNYLILYDPFDLDASHVARYREIIPAPRLSTFRLPFSGHPSGYFLSETGVLKAVTNQLITQGSLPDLRQLNIDRFQSQYYRYCIVKRHAIGTPDRRPKRTPRLWLGGLSR